ncbi:multi-sensor signal transduction histidine kinase [Stappia aggregata IAM 12614]|uniref:Multi-sensor signal transduction histidine kinase n=2 Tax=Roseibium aggregatum TaxID=187304 RepID=A0P2Z7_ROSAI|nr:multi-sensor signal transduction histidine kinase [Stappia aggregata IAM 12614] [Roseibium aggregatum IAM 12614]
MIHPDAASDPFLAPLHRSFLFSCFASGAAALVVLPLHLALAGAPQVATLLALAWMLSQWPLALYLSQSGALSKAAGLSASLFAMFVAGVCAVTGGAQSFALAWLLVPPVEAALAASRRTALAVTGLCGALVLGLTFVPLPLSPVSGLPGLATPLAALAAVLYVGLLSLRIAFDRALAQKVVRSTEEKRLQISQSVADIYCELAPSGTLKVIGGPVKEVLGHLPAESDEDWLFPRLHVADRPLYLTCLSEARLNGVARTFEARLRVGANRPGEAGQADYRRMEVHLRPGRQSGSVSAQVADLLLTLRPVETIEPLAAAGAGMSALGSARADRISRDMLETAGVEASRALADILAHSERLDRLGRENSDPALRQAVEALRQSGERGLASLTAALDLVPAESTASQPDIAGVDVETCLNQCMDMVATAALRRGVSVQMASAQECPPVAADRKLLRQALCFLLADMVETSEAGAVLSVDVQSGAGSADFVFSTKNRQSSLCWSTEASATVLGLSRALLERMGGNLTVHTVLGQGESVIVTLPLKTQAQQDTGQSVKETTAERLARSA